MYSDEIDEEIEVVADVYEFEVPMLGEPDMPDEEVFDPDDTYVEGVDAGETGE